MQRCHVAVARIETITVRRNSIGYEDVREGVWGSSFASSATREAAVRTESRSRHLDSGGGFPQWRQAAPAMAGSSYPVVTGIIS